MSTVSSYSLLSRAPPPGNFSRALMQPGKQAAAVALPWVPSKHSRAPLSAVFCTQNKHTYDIQPLALVHPKFPPTSDKKWRITEDADHINLWLYVGDNTGKDKLEVATEGEVLLIRYKGSSNEDNPASLLDVRLLMPHGYDGKKVEADLAFGSLLVTVSKPKHEPNKIPIGDKPTTTN
ncbi:uncharacterized protein LOC133903609 [Phragmites australis]|uniref:uncharacterized protein LOC133903609 n=1 Tax=Phragmites australis TaxID=29695 RepID=UPI002D79303A|nr:uncharacterized protein LOC133903609 [Phragmites australis]